MILIHIPLLAKGSGEPLIEACLCSPEIRSRISTKEIPISKSKSNVPPRKIKTRLNSTAVGNCKKDLKAMSSHTHHH